jgi:GSCFA family
MVFRTALHIPPSSIQISHRDSILLFGSCFSQNIGERLQKYKFNCISNPFGTIFNPISISKLIGYACKNQIIQEGELIFSQGIYVHPDFHSVLSDVEIPKALQKINQAVETTFYNIKECTHIFFTLGTAIAYKMNATDQIVANCHKIPASYFKKVDISISDGQKAMEEMIRQIRQLNPNVHIIFTVSPVRHIKDGIIENTKSKARLLCMIDEIIQHDEGVSYFPAYDIMMDDLRDYRFYEADMIHPNDIAIDYIWEKFSGHYFTNETISLNKQIHKIHLASQHRPFNPESEQHQSFVRHTLAEIDTLRKQYEGLNFDLEMELLNRSKT